jgi:hypothetical protein
LRNGKLPKTIIGLAFFWSDGKPTKLTRIFSFKIKDFKHDANAKISLLAYSVKVGKRGVTILTLTEFIPF